MLPFTSLQTSYNDLITQYCTYLHYLHPCSVNALEVCDKCGNKVLHKVKPYSHWICILCNYCLSFHAHHTSLSGLFPCSCERVEIGKVPPRESSIRILE